MAQHDLYDWLLLFTGGAGVLSALGGVGAYRGKARSEQRAQAQNVVVWCEPADDRNGFEFVIRNSGEWPISQLRLWIKAEGGDATLAVGLVDRGQDYRLPATTNPRDAVFWPLPVACWFYDAAGREWYRDDVGRLYRWNWATRRRLSFQKWRRNRAAKWRRRRLRWNSRRRAL